MTNTRPILQFMTKTLMVLSLVLILYDKRAVADPVVRTFRHSDICGRYNNHRVYLELNEKGILQASNVTYNQVSCFYFDYKMNSIFFYCVLLLFASFFSLSFLFNSFFDNWFETSTKRARWARWWARVQSKQTQKVFWKVFTKREMKFQVYHSFWRASLLLCGHCCRWCFKTTFA